VTRRAVVLAALATALLPPAWCRADELPVVAPGAPIAVDAAAATLFHPSTMRAAFRVARYDGALYIGTPWYVRDLAVTVVGPGARRQTIPARIDLPGRVLGLRLPADAWTADRLELQASTVSTAVPPYLLSGEQLAAIGWRHWSYAACFGLFLSLTLVFGGLALLVRSRAVATFAVVAGAQAALAVPWLGIVRPPPEISQLTHAALQSLAFVALMAFAQAYFVRARLPRYAVRAVWALVLLNVIAVCEGDVLQDIWVASDAVTQALLIALNVSFVGLGILALRHGDAGARVYIAATALGTIGVVIADVAPPNSPLLLAATIGGAGEALLLALALALRLRIDERGGSERARWSRLDGLTALTNRTALDPLIASAWERARLARAPLSALLIDIDHFKPFNEAYGHLAGDDALRRIADTLVVRASDLAGRYAGDKFLLVLEATDLDAARRVAEALRAGIFALEIPHGSVPARRLTVSVGTASLVPDRDGDGTVLLRRAETALYIAKTMGRNRVVADEPVAPPAAVG
jgi:diguanylate cyclase (GGDEF)-like protein